MNKEVEDENRRKLLSAVLNADDFRPAAALVRAEFGARSHRGRVHQENDDHYLVVRLAQHLETLLTSLASVDSAVYEWTQDVVNDEAISDVLASRRTQVEQ